MINFHKTQITVTQAMNFQNHLKIKCLTRKYVLEEGK